MNWRWLLWDFADPKLPLTFRQRRKIASRWRSWTMPPSAVRGRILAVTAMIPAQAFILFWLFAWPAQLQSLPPAVELPAVVVLWWVWMCLAYGWLCRKEVFYWIRQEGFDVCRQCGYWLRELPDDVEHCPECGGQRVRMPESVK